MRRERLHAGVGLNRNIEIKFDLFVLEMDSIVRLHLNGTESSGPRRQIIAQVNHDDENRQIKDRAADQVHSFQLRRALDAGGRIQYV